jgi:hypothetical protein
MLARRGAWTLGDLGYDEGAEWSLPATPAKRSVCASCEGSRVWSSEARRAGLSVAAGAILAAIRRAGARILPAAVILTTAKAEANPSTMTRAWERKASFPRTV